MTSMPYAMQTFGTVPRIGFVGDTHGNLGHLLAASRLFKSHGIAVVTVLGDFGFVWPGVDWGRDLDKLERRLADQQQTLFFVDGNHDWHPRLREFDQGEDGIRWVRSNVGYVPRGYRVRLASGSTLAALGGANSIDREHRVSPAAAGRHANAASWWPEESITDVDLDVLGTDSADVLIAHDAPLHVPALDAMLARTDRYWSPEGRAYAAAGRRKFHEGFLRVRPRVSLSGHYHYPVDETVTYDADPKFSCRVVVLDMAAGDSRSASQAILDVATLDVQILNLNGHAVRISDSTPSGSGAD
ncbi:metallophosphoesterase [Diaminobutyricimonas sp. LJ205]|uniref:metallophosphoesterase family protein n=1 Tax=Diaminobutyricimonas sp. LJ205 TaxID=2683590 RepID=UPI0012F4CA86|nr:metallophosphoesterase [Diaminobutyricimonas sp. LJ205]